MLLALALHAAALGGSLWTSRRAPSSRVALDIDAELELWLTDAVALETHPLFQASRSLNVGSVAAGAEPPRVRSQAPAGASRRLVATPTPSQSGSARTVAGATPASATHSSLPGSPPRGAIDLGLNGGVRQAQLIASRVELPYRPERPTDAGLRQGLAALDAERGLSRSSAAHSAAYQAARHVGPTTGIGGFELVTDERGSVRSVTLASASADAAKWEQVALELQYLLIDRRLRVPPGAKGLVVRLRIETGDLAMDGAERFRSKRGAALEQDVSRRHEVRDESTRSSLEPGQLSPTLGIELAGSGPQHRVRVVLLDERAL